MATPAKEGGENVPLLAETTQDTPNASSSDAPAPEEEFHPDEYKGFHEDACEDIVHESEKPPNPPGQGEGAMCATYEKEVAKEAEKAPEKPKEVSTGFQLMLCLLLIFIAMYEVIFKKKAMMVAKLPGSIPFDFSSVVIWNSVASIIIGCGLSVKEKTTDQLINKTDSLKMLAIFAPVGVVFGFCSVLQFIILQYIPPDVFKVLEQMRLLCVAVVSRLLMGKRQTWLSWLCLVAICLSAIVYSFISRTSKVTSVHSKMVDFALAGTHNTYNLTLDDHKGLQGAMFPKGTIIWKGEGNEKVGIADWSQLQALATGNDAERVMKQIGYKEHLVEYLHDLVKHIPKGEKENAYGTGIMLTGLLIFLMTAAGVYSEKTMKQYHKCPFYIQKVYMELPTLVFGLCFSAFINPWLISMGVGKPSKAQTFFENPFAGWGSTYLILCFITFMGKSWLSGIIVKMLSSLGKQLCSIVTVALVYFFLLIHMCDFDPYTAATFLCVDGARGLSMEITFADFAVMVAVGSYVMSQNQARQLQALQEKDGGEKKEAK